MKCRIDTKGGDWLQQDNVEVIEFKMKPVLERYYNEDTSWGVFNFTTHDDIPEYNEYRDPLSDDFNDVQKMSTLCGKMQQLYIGSEYLVKAYCEYNKKFDQYQYVPVSVVATTPKSYEDQRTFLKSLTSESIAENILNEYPNVVEDVMNGELKDLEYDKIHGVGKATWDRVRKSIIDNYVVSEIITLLQPLGVTYNIIKKLLNFETNPSLLKEKLLNNPYMMTRVRGLGFKRVDDLALKLKPELRHSIERLTAFIMYHLRSIGENDGHTWITLNQLKNDISDNVNDCYDLLDELLDHNLFLYIEDDKVGLKEYRNVESRIYQILIDKEASENTRINIDDMDGVNKCIQDVEKEQGFEYTEEQKNVIIQALNNNLTIISGKAGCVDCDTEFFNGREWKKISEFKEGDLVLQYHKDGTADLVKPIAYIKHKKDYLYHFSTKYGLDQCLSEDHNCILLSQKGNMKEEKFSSVMQRQNELRFYDKFITSFSYSGVGINVSDDMLRLLIAASADASYNYNVKEGANTYNRARFRLKKARKISRLINIIKRLNLDYEIKNFGTDDHVSIYVQLPYRIREFPDEWYQCNRHQLEIIADEVMYWDGYKAENRYSTTIKKNADFIQFVYTALNKRSTILTNDRVNTPMKQIGDKTYMHQSIEYSVSFTDRTRVGLTCDKRKNHTPTQFEKYKTKDGYEYCFTVPTHMLVLRRNNKIFITGNCGKTSIARGILKTYQEFDYSISACALSAKAAQRIKEATGFEASTIHRLLGAQGLNEFEYNYNHPLPTDVVLIDEASMINAQLFLDLLLAINENTRIVICGDHMQLPPIGYGNIFSDILHREEFKESSFQLTKPMRQALLSGILSDANLIRDGISPISEPEPKIIRGKLNDMYYLFRDSRDTLNKIAINTYLASVKTDGLDEVVIITPRKKGCANSSSEINKIIQQMLLGKEKQTIKSSVQEFKLGAKVMQIVNNYEKNIFNGEIGYITYIGEKTEGKKKVQYCEVSYDDPLSKVENHKKIIEYKSNELNELELAYALTCHKCQGSGVNTVIGIIDNTHYTLLDNCMLYTLITRAKKRCCLLSEPSAFIRCIKTNHNTSRQTWLSLDSSIK